MEPGRVGNRDAQLSVSARHINHNEITSSEKIKIHVSIFNELGGRKTFSMWKLAQYATLTKPSL